MKKRLDKPQFMMDGRPFYEEYKDEDGWHPRVQAYWKDGKLLVQLTSISPWWTRTYVFTDVNLNLSWAPTCPECGDKVEDDDPCYADISDNFYHVECAILYEHKVGEFSAISSYYPRGWAAGEDWGDTDNALRSD